MFREAGKRPWLGVCFRSLGGRFRRLKCTGHQLSCAHFFQAGSLPSDERNEQLYSTAHRKCLYISKILSRKAPPEWGGSPICSSVMLSPDPGRAHPLISPRKQGVVPPPGASVFAACAPQTFKKTRTRSLP